MNANVFPADFPGQLAAEALVDAGEAAWKPSLAVEAVEWLGLHGYAVLGTEMLRAGRDGIQSLPYFQKVDRRAGEAWNRFAARAAAETVVYLKAFGSKLAGEGDVYVNITWVNESDFQNLKIG